MPELVADPQRLRTDFTPPALQHPCSQDPAPQRLSSSPKSGTQHPLDVVGSPQRPRTGSTTTPPGPLPTPSPVQEPDSTARPRRQVRPRKKYIPETGKWE